MHLVTANCWFLIEGEGRERLRKRFLILLPLMNLGSHTNREKTMYSKLWAARRGLVSFLGTGSVEGRGSGD